MHAHPHKRKRAHKYTGIAMGSTRGHVPPPPPHLLIGEWKIGRGLVWATAHNLPLIMIFNVQMGMPCWYTNIQKSPYHGRGTIFFFWPASLPRFRLPPPPHWKILASPLHECSYDHTQTECDWISFSILAGIGVKWLNKMHNGHNNRATGVNLYDLSLWGRWIIIAHSD